MLFCRLEEKYGWFFFLKMGSYKVVMVVFLDVVYEMFVMKLVDYVGR